MPLHVSFESKHGSLASHKPRSEQADDTDMRTNVIENRARLQVLRQCLLDWWFLFSARVVHLKARVEVGPQSLSKSTRDSEPDIARMARAKSRQDSFSRCFERKR